MDYLSVSQEITDNRMVWAHALRSGFYKQGQGQLIRETPKGEHTYCCLGVATMHFAGMAALHAVIGEGRYNGGYTCEVPTIVDEKLGLDNEVRNFLASTNDAHHDFHYIADLIARTATVHPDHLLAALRKVDNEMKAEIAKDAAVAPEGWDEADTSTDSL